MSHEEVAELLETAADLIESVGHVKGLYEAREAGALLLGKGGRKVVGYCAVGAICAAYNPVERHFDAHRVRAGINALHHTVFETGPQTQTGLGNIALWNDTPGRTPGQVIDALKLAAKDLRNAA